jgi:hypothetical protein
MTVRSILLLAFSLASSLALVPSAGYAAADPCSATLTPDSKLTIPSLNVDGSFYFLVLQIDSISGDLVQAEIVGTGPATVQNCASPATLIADSTSDTIQVLYIPSLIYGSDEYGVELAAVATPDGPASALLRASNPSAILRIRNAYLKKGVWIGHSHCVEKISAMPGGGVGTITQTANATLAFACTTPTPLNLGSFNCIAPGETGTWKLVSGAVTSYTYNEVDSAAGCTITITGRKAFSLPIPNAAHLQITDNGANFGYDLDIGVGIDLSPLYMKTIDIPCAGPLPVPINPLTKARDAVIWLAFPTGLSFPSSATTFTDSKDVPTPGGITSCTWDFTWIPPHVGVQ